VRRDPRSIDEHEAVFACGPPRTMITMIEAMLGSLSTPGRP
jgi:hypothetical protein